MEKLDLKDFTFIIPVKIESEDREQNFRFIMKYFHDKIDTNIIITESYHNDDLVLKKYYSDILDRCNVKLIEKPNEKYFHRTKYLNDMLLMSKTKITVNYDIDVFLPLNKFSEARKMIDKKVDLVYPFGFGDFQLQVPQSYQDELLSTNIITIDPKKLKINKAEYGHMQIFNTESYIKGFGENENFISYGPEDQERFFRFKTLGYNVKHFDNGFVYHLEHSRGKDSSRHKHYDSNVLLWEKLKKLSKNNLLDYYKEEKYNEKFNNRG